MCVNKTQSTGIFEERGVGMLRCIPRSLTVCDSVYGGKRGVHQGVWEVGLMYWLVCMVVGVGPKSRKVGCCRAP